MISLLAKMRYSFVIVGVDVFCMVRLDSSCVSDKLIRWLLKRPSVAVYDDDDVYVDVVR